MPTPNDTPILRTIDSNQNISGFQKYLSNFLPFPLLAKLNTWFDMFKYMTGMDQAQHVQGILYITVKMSTYVRLQHGEKSHKNNILRRSHSLANVQCKVPKAF